MTIKESVEQLENLIEAWQLDEADLNQTDIDAIDCVLQKRKELIDYLIGQIKLCKKAQQLALKNKNIEQVGFLNLRIAIYQEILSKIEKR